MLSMFKMMDTVQSLPDALGPSLVLLLLSALILEWYNLVCDLLLREQLAHRSAFTRLSIRSLYHWPSRIGTLKNRAIEVFRDFVSSFQVLP